ncbi:heterokaryon incompatibility protein-domain-containing protein [Nemania sp. FL0031]|nr:heterokaryon incompatibility protein-domain-containing protein [Nemania sp. FL0031]
MRLINVNTYAIQEFFDGCIPEYAILSHTWGEEEVTFQDMQHLNAKVEAKLGFKKIEATCQQAQRDRLDWAWVDTCCIDKTSSAELSEAINSMFQWYAKSKICYAFLADATNSSDMLKSRWFRRGWTLQELLAPSEVIFYSAQWSVLGHKTSVVTGFHEVLTHFDPRDWTIAEKMTWASKRQTTRVEDIAYCLLGIFSVNIPLLYGEGERAFTRLQEEIMRISNDQKLPCGFLARRPANFVVRPHPVPDLYSDKPFKERRNRYDETAPAYSMSNRGIHIQLFLIPLSPEEPTTFYALLGNTSPSPDLPGHCSMGLNVGSEMESLKNSF